MIHSFWPLVLAIYVLGLLDMKYTRVFSNPIPVFGSKWVLVTAISAIALCKDYLRNGEVAGILRIGFLLIVMALLLMVSYSILRNENSTSENRDSGF